MKEYFSEKYTKIFLGSVNWIYGNYSCLEYFDIRKGVFVLIVSIILRNPFLKKITYSRISQEI